MKDFRQLQVWEKSHKLTLMIYDITASFPKEEMFGLTSQMRRASSSIAANIAEGCGRGTDADFARILQIANGSAREVEYFLILANDLKYVKADKHKAAEAQATEVVKMLASLIRTIKNSA